MYATYLWIMEGHLRDTVTLTGVDTSDQLHTYTYIQYMHECAC